MYKRQDVDGCISNHCFVYSDSDVYGMGRKRTAFASCFRNDDGAWATQDLRLLPQEKRRHTHLLPASRVRKLSTIFSDRLNVQSGTR